jgi:hypothetical protein
MTNFRCFPFLAALALLCASAASLRAAEEIKVPFNFRWGDGSQLVDRCRLVRGQLRVDGRPCGDGSFRHRRGSYLRRPTTKHEKCHESR